MKVIYRGLCPADSNDIDSIRLGSGRLCEICENKQKGLKIKEIDKFFPRDSLYYEFKFIERNKREFIKFCNKVIGKPYTAQLNWFTKAILSESFAITVPTGLGKTTFGILYILYLYYGKLTNILENRKVKHCFFIAPTRLLVQQTYERFIEFSKKAGLELRIIHSNEKDKKALKQKLKEKEFDIAILTPSFLLKNKELFTSNEFLGIASIIFVDDVDALLKRSKSIDIILHMLGFDDTLLKEVRPVLRKPVKDVTVEERKVLLENINKYKENKEIGQLIFSSATTRVFTSRIRLLRYLLNFEPGSSLELFRKVYDVYITFEKRDNILADIINDTAKWVKKLGKGGLIFIPLDKGEKFLNELYTKLKEEGINCEIVSSSKGRDYLKIIEKFKNEEIDVLIGYAIFYGPLVRGIDLPAVIKYAIFTGIPKFKLKAGEEEIKYNPLRMLWLASLILTVIEDQNSRLEILNISNKIRKITQKYTPEELKFLISTRQISSIALLQENLNMLYNKLNQYLQDENFIKKLEEKAHISIVNENNSRYFIFADSLTYIQASGRTSRMFFGGITTGLSILLIDDNKVFKGLDYQLQRRYENFVWLDKQEFEKKFKEIIQRIKLERRAIKEKNIKYISKEIKKIKNALLVVESPTKAKTISYFFGKPAVRLINGIPVYECVTGEYILNIIPTLGHIFDLVYAHDDQKIFYGIKKENHHFVPIYTTIKRCRDCGHSFTEATKEIVVKGAGNEKTLKCPKCGSTNIFDSINIINAIRKLAMESDLVILTTDPDSEGEKIAYDVFLSLKPLLIKKEIKRMELHEITFKAFNKEIKNLREINLNMVYAQILRRIGDRWVGFSISSVLQHQLSKKTLGAGRVQTPVLNWIIAKYKEASKTKDRYIFINTKINEAIQGPSLKIKVNPELGSLINSIKKEIKRKGIINVKEEIIKEEEISPPKPLNTSDMLIKVANKFKITVEQIMRLAQDLFEAGLITYHRTDSRYISDVGFKIAQQYLEQKGMQHLFVKKQYDKPGAHECIRPTRPLDRNELENLVSTGQLNLPIQLTPLHYKLYDLIFNTFVASQMKSAKVIKKELQFEDIDVPTEEGFISVQIEKVEGIIEYEKESFAKVLPIPINEVLSKLSRGSQLKIDKVTKVTLKLKLYTEDEIINKMKEENIGRPSTYAIIIQKLKEHGYVISSKKKKALIPTNLGISVMDIIQKNFGWLANVELTRKFEEAMDKIERGVENEKNVMEKIKEFFDEYYQKIKNAVVLK
jgi:reverse gyrase